MITKVFMICDAYEAGFGKGQDHRHCDNPFLEDTECHEAWAIGYRAGFGRLKPASEADMRVYKAISQRYFC